MTLQDLIKSLTPDNYLQIAQIHKKWISLLHPSASVDRISQAMQTFGATLSNITPKPSTGILLALPIYEDCVSEIHAEYFEKQEVIAKREFFMAKKMPAYSKTDDAEKLLSIPKELYNCLPSAYGYEFSPWEDILGAAVYPENFEHIGKIPFVASALWDMSFIGTTEEGHKKAREDLQASFDEMDKIQQLPEEEQSQYYHTPAELGWDMEDNRTENEKEEQRRLIYLDSVQTWESWLRELQRLDFILCSM